MNKLAIAGLMGLAVGLLVWGGRDWLSLRFEADAEWLRQTSLRFSPRPVNARKQMLTYYAIAIVILAGLILITPHPVIGVALWLVLLSLPKIVVEMFWQRRREKINQQLAATIASMCNSIRAGLTLVQAMERLAENAPEPIRTDFRVMVNRYSYGMNLETTIRETKERLKLPNFNLFASALLLNRELGGDVADTLSRISQSLDKLHQMRQTVEAHTAEGRTNIKVLLVAPVLMLLMMASVDSEGVKRMFTTPPGYAVLLVAALLIATGVFFANKVTNTEI